MDLIDQLESRIDALLTKLAELNEENARLRQSAASDASMHEEEQRRLREELQQEREAKNAVLSRIDALLEKLKFDPEES